MSEQTVEKIVAIAFTVLFMFLFIHFWACPLDPGDWVMDLVTAFLVAILYSVFISIAAFIAVLAFCRAFLR